MLRNGGSLQRVSPSVEWPRSPQRRVNWRRESAAQRMAARDGNDAPSEGIGDAKRCNTKAPTLGSGNLSPLLTLSCCIHLAAQASRLCLFSPSFREEDNDPFLGVPQSEKSPPE